MLIIAYPCHEVVDTSVPQKVFPVLCQETWNHTPFAGPSRLMAAGSPSVPLRACTSESLAKDSIENGSN